jgi:osmotically-inducible protein OsmY
MNKKHTIPFIVAAGIFGAATGPAVVFAADQAMDQQQMDQETMHDAMDKKQMDQEQMHGAMNKEQMHDNQGQSAIKDAWLHGKLETTLLFNEHLNSFDIDSEVKNGIAYLRGAVESDIDRDLAGEIAKSINGVTKVENELTVDKTKASKSSNNAASMERQGFKESVVNSTLTARIKTKLLANGNTGGMAIDVDSKKGVVTLSGTVKSAEERDLAVQLASNTSGASSVTDHLTIAPQ